MTLEFVSYKLAAEFDSDACKTSAESLSEHQTLEERIDDYLLSLIDSDSEGL